MSAVAELLQAAAAWVRSGQWGPAEQAYRQVLRTDPGHGEALAQLGLLAYQGGQVGPAAEYLGQAAAARPADAECHNNLGAALLRLGRAAEAEAAARAALRLRPGYPAALANLAIALRTQGRPAEAEAAYREALRLRPDLSESHSGLGDVLREQSRPAEAEAAYREALRLRPDVPDVLNSLGCALSGQSRPAEAEAAYREALRLRPDYAEAHTNLGIVVQGQGRLAEAEAVFRAAIRLRPDFAEAHYNLGHALRDWGRSAESEVAYREALRLRPDFAEAHYNLGHALCAQGRLDEGEAKYRTALRLRPNYADAHTNLAMLLLSRGRYAEGWAEYEWRWSAQGVARLDLGRPAWDGSPVRGALLLYTEQGLGDTLQFVRYARLARARAGAVLVACSAALVPLLSTCPGIDRLVPDGTPLPPFDAQAPLLSLPHLLGTTLETVPAEVPYLSADPDRVECWRERLGPLAGFRVGIAWQGNVAHPGQQRFMPLRSFAALVAVPGVRLVSLQRGAGAEQLAAASELAIHDLGPDVDAAGAFVDTAAVMRNLDLVVSADTAVAHLAGALGVPVWIALAHAPNFRWLVGREDSPWYPSLRLFRQPRPGDWAAVFERIADALSARLAGGTGRLGGVP